MNTESGVILHELDGMGKVPVPYGPAWRGTRASTKQSEQKGASSGAKRTYVSTACQDRIEVLLHGRDGSEFEVAILDWGGSTKAYPDEGPPRWIEIRAKVSTPTVGWTFGGECLDDEEVESLTN